MRLRIGDLYLRKRDPSRAIEAYEHVAGQLAQKGFDAKAAAIYKQILRIDANHVSARVHLGELHQRQGLISDALREFEQAVEYYRQRGKRHEAFELLRRVAALDPGNIPNRLGLADLLFRENLKDEAAEEYRALLRDVQAEERPDELAHVAQRMLEQFPDDPEAFCALASGKIECGAAREAIKPLEKLLPRFPDNVEVREALVKTYEAVGDNAAIQNMYRDIAELYKEQGYTDRARDIVQRYVCVDPLSVNDGSTPPSIELTDEVEELGGGFEFEERFDSDADLDLDAELDLGEGDDVPELPPLEGEGGDGIELTGDAGPPPGLQDLLAESRVALEFGDLGDAEARAREALEVEPSSDEARALLAECLAQKGDLKEAIRLTVERRDLAASVAEGELLSEIEAKLREYEEREAQDTEQGEYGEFPDPESAQLEEAGQGGLRDIEIELITDTDQDSRGASVEPPPGLREPRARPAPRAPKQTEPEPELLDIGLEEASSDRDGTSEITEACSEAEFYFEQGMLDEAERVLRAILERVPQHPQALARLGEISASRGEAPDAIAPPSGSTFLEETVVQPQGETGSDLGQDLGSSPLELSEEEPEDDSFGAGIELDLDDDSQPAVSRGSSQLSFDLDIDDDVEVEAPRGGPDEREMSASPSEPEAVAFDLDLEEGIEGVSERAGADENPFDLAAELESAIIDDETMSASTLSGVAAPADGVGPGFGEVFSAFKRAIQEQLGDGESQAHYDLGIAYREMGLLEDAIREFEVASRGPSLELEALALLGACKIDVGQPREAMPDIQRALALAGDGTEAALALRYERARALEACGQKGRALQEYRQVHGSSPDFRDVAEKVAELEGSKE